MLKKIIIMLLLFYSFLNGENIKVGMSTDLSGPLSTLGESMKIGIQTYFLKNNNQKKKHTFSLVVYDDGYNPVKASQNVEKLIENEKVLSFIGNLGSPTANLTLPIIKNANISLFGAYTGANLLRKEPSDKNVFNYRVSYKQEVKFIISKLLENGIMPKDMVFFSQNDIYGNSGYMTAIEELEKRGFKDAIELPHGRYNSHSLNVEKGLSKLLDSTIDPKVILMFATTNPIIKFMKLAKKDFPKAIFISISPISRDTIIKELKDLSDGLIITQVTPLLSSSLPIVKEFLSEVKEKFPKHTPNLSTLEGYIVSKLFVQSINQSKIEPRSKENIIKIFQNTKNIDIGLDFISGFNHKYNQYSSKVWVSIIKDAKLKEFQWNILEGK